MANKLFQLSRYFFSSALSFGATLFLTFVSHDILGIGEELAFGITLILVFGMNFLLLRFFVYPDSRSQNIKKQFFACLASSACFRFVEYGCFLGLHTFLNMPYLVAICLILVISFFSKFFFYRKVVFYKTDTESL